MRGSLGRARGGSRKLGREDGSDWWWWEETFRVGRVGDLQTCMCVCMYRLHMCIEKRESRWLCNFGTGGSIAFKVPAYSDTLISPLDSDLIGPSKQDILK